MLTTAEQYAALSATWFGQTCWGVVEHATMLCPEACVAAHRGARFQRFKLRDGTTALRGKTDRDETMLLNAMVDVAEWLGFESTCDYMRALAERGSELLKEKV